MMRKPSYRSWKTNTRRNTIRYMFNVISVCSRQHWSFDFIVLTYCSLANKLTFIFLQRWENVSHICVFVSLFCSFFISNRAFFYTALVFVMSDRTPEAGKPVLCNTVLYLLCPIGSAWSCQTCFGRRAVTRCCRMSPDGDCVVWR